MRSQLALSTYIRRHWFHSPIGQNTLVSQYHNAEDLSHFQKQLISPLSCYDYHLKKVWTINCLSLSLIVVCHHLNVGSLCSARGLLFAHVCLWCKWCLWFYKCPLETVSNRFYGNCKIVVVKVLLTPDVVLKTINNIYCKLDVWSKNRPICLSIFFNPGLNKTNRVL